jgi:uncharacterized protein YndB with AHSA1/START domain
VIYVTVERVVARRPEVVWEVAADVAALPAWVEGLVEAELRSDRLEVGAIVDVVRKTGKKRFEAACEITALRPPRMIAVETRLPTLLLLDRLEIEGVDGGSSLAVHSELVFGSRIAEFFARPRGLLGASNEDHAVQGIYERSLDALVKRIEAVSAAPYR